MYYSGNTPSRPHVYPLLSAPGPLSANQRSNGCHSLVTRRRTELCRPNYDVKDMENEKAERVEIGRRVDDSCTVVRWGPRCAATPSLIVVPGFFYGLL